MYFDDIHSPLLPVLLCGKNISSVFSSQMSNAPQGGVRGALTGTLLPLLRGVHFYFVKILDASFQAYRRS